eukprot:scaffold1936_cov21-Tisochrysis_lutea.AAC.1
MCVAASLTVPGLRQTDRGTVIRFDYRHLASAKLHFSAGVRGLGGSSSLGSAFFSGEISPSSFSCTNTRSRAGQTHDQCLVSTREALVGSKHLKHPGQHVRGL